MDFQSVVDGDNPSLMASDGMTLEAVRANLEAVYGGQIDSLVGLAEAHEVGDEADEKKAIDMAGQAKKLLKDLEHQRKLTIADAGTFVRGVNGFCKVFKDKIARIEKVLKGKIGQFQWQKELERRKREKAAQEAAEKLKKQAEKEAKEAGVEAPVVAAAPVEKKETVTRANSGASAHIRTAWDFEVLDFAKVPDKYKELDKRAIKIAIQAGVREVAGIRIFETATTVLRA